MAAALMAAVVALLAGAVFATLLDEPGRRAVFGKVVELSIQFVVVVVLGTLLKKVIDDAQERRAAQAAHHQLQSGFVRRLVDASHNEVFSASFR
jgi:ABC-type transport system involved in cytochrome bd biosynthesis fused ATPase/permease subunit